MLFKANPLLTRWIEVLTLHSTHPGRELAYLIIILLSTNMLWSAGLPWITRKAEDISLAPVKAYLLALPATFVYCPLMLTLMQDVMNQTFSLGNRLFLLFALVVGSQLLTVFYAFAIKKSDNQTPIGLESGLNISLFFLLVSIPASILLIGMNQLKPFFDANPF